MLRRSFFLLIVVATIATHAVSLAQPPSAAKDAKDAAPPPGVDKYYFDLTKSQDRLVRDAVQRYMNLVKTQEWSDKSGQFKIIAYYVKHDPNLTTVTIAVVKGRGADRTTEEKTVPVDKLSSTCQSRVHQIDAAQKKLQEMAGSKPGENGAPPPPGAPPELPGATPAGLNAGGPPGAPAGAPSAGPTAPPEDETPDPSANDPDPAGFAELQPPPAMPPGTFPPGAGPPADGGPGAVPPGATPEPTGPGRRAGPDKL